MKLFHLISLAFILGIVACNSTDSETNSKITESQITNALLPTDVTVRHLFPFHPANEDWIKSFDYKKFIDDVFDAVRNEKVVAFDFLGTYYTNNIKMNKRDIDFVLHNGVDTVELEDVETGEITIKIINNELNMDEITQLFFKENWVLEEETFKLSKEVLGYGIVKEYYKNDDIEKAQLTKKILFELNFDNDLVDINSSDVKEKELLAENITYEFLLDNDEWIKNLNNEKFIKILLEKVKSGEVKAFDFYENSKQVSMSDIKMAMGIPTDTVMVEDLETGEMSKRIIENEITTDLFGSYVFIEDWYIDRSSYKIVKEIKGMAPVYYFYRNDEDAELSKKIPFVVWF